MSNYLEAALNYHRAGLKVIPFWTDSEGDKVFPKEYATYREAQTEADIRRLFAPTREGIALLCVDGIEAVDIDAKHDPKGTIIADLLPAFKEFGITNFHGLVQKTKSGGRHIIYRCPNPEGNMKLARRSGCKEAIIETRGKGGILFITPTPGYELVQGDFADLPAYPLLKQEDRDLLISVCRHFDETEPVKFEAKVEPAAQATPGKKSWEAYDETTDVLGVMEHYGWRVITKRGDYIRLNRPNAKHGKGIDGSVIVSKNVFYPFTSSEQFTPNKGYSPSAVYAVMECGNDFSRAAKELYKMGFGDRMEQAAQVEQQKTAQEAKVKLPELLARVEQTRFDLHKRTVEPKALLKYEDHKSMPIGGRGMIGIFTGHEKSGKSFVGSCIAASGLAGGREVLNLSLDLDGGRMLWFDTEQSGYFYEKTQGRIHRLAGMEQNATNYTAYHLRPLTQAERLEVVEHYVYNTPDLAVVMIDGFIDLITDYNNLEQTQEYVQRLMRWSDERQILILGVLHVNKGDGKIRGHIGSELKNKCDFIIHTTKDGPNGYTFSNPTSRYAAFPDQMFTRDSDGLPQYQPNVRFYGAPGPSRFENNTAPDPNQFTMPARMNEEDIPF